MTATDIAYALGISRERVRQHLVVLGLPTVTARSKPNQGKEYGGRARCGPMRTGGIRTPVTAKVAGTIGELLAAADLTARGYTVYIPITRHAAHADLIALKQGSEELPPLTIEVRCGSRRVTDGLVTFARKVESKATHHAIVITGDDVLYDPPIDGDSPQRLQDYVFASGPPVPSAENYLWTLSPGERKREIERVAAERAHPSRDL